MELRTATFRMELAAHRRADDEDWARVRVNVQAGGFTGDFEAWLQSGDLEVFSNQLAVLYDKAGKLGTAKLECAERGIYLSLSMLTTGSIDGEYRFFDERTSATLSGTFCIDQSYIPEWRSCIESFALELRQHAL